MCIDYTGLNKCCPKDHFALPRIDQVVDSTAGSELLCFLDAYSGYHQIKMRESDQLKTSFTTPYGTFCYFMMLFGLKMLGLRTNDACKDASTSKLAAMFTSMLMILPSCLVRRHIC